jgi:hypothetical protein
MIDLLLTVRRLLPVHRDSRLLLREVAVAAASVRWRNTRIWDAVVATVLRGAAAVLRRAAVLRPTVLRASTVHVSDFGCFCGASSSSLIAGSALLDRGSEIRPFVN